MEGSDLIISNNNMLNLIVSKNKYALYQYALEIQENNQSDMGFKGQIGFFREPIWVPKSAISAHALWTQPDMGSKIWISTGQIFMQI